MRRVFVFYLVSALAPFVTAAEKPSIVYILMDDAGYGDLSCYGQKKFQTPNMDRLAAEGMKFTDHYSGSTVCAPTRCCLMMGVHTGHAFIRGNREVQPEGQWPIPADAVTIPRLLKKAGYTTGMFGKWGLGPPASHADPTAHFDQFYGYNCQRKAHTYYPAYLWDNDKKHNLDGKTYSQDLIASRALEFIRANKERPFFCYMSITVPHAAMHVPEESAAPFRKKFPQFENKIGKYSGPPVKNPIAAFAGMMTRLDGQVGQLLDLLDELGIDGNTLVMLTSDNGPHLEGGHDPRFFDSNGPLRGFKRDLYEGGIRVPLMARWPGKIKPNSQSNLVSAQWDMLPTFCELAAMDAPRQIDGISIAPTLLGKTKRQKQHAHLYWEYRGRTAARAGKWKAVSRLAKGNSEPLVELYDLSSDIGETKNVAGNHPDVVAKMRDVLRTARTEPISRVPKSPINSLQN
jgi:arylsulfatase A-like enzyme